MASRNKMSKTDKRKHRGVGGSFLKYTGKLKRIAFFNASMRKKINKIEDAEI